MTETPNGGSAFPNTIELGMSLRDWFAGQALAGFAARRDVMGTWDHLAKMAYIYADEMIKARRE